MKKLTIETNSIIALENKEKTADDISKLIEMNEKGKINLRLGAISASENLPSGKKLKNFSEFKKRITKVGLSKVELLNPIGYLDITYFDHCVFSGPEAAKLEKKIQKIIHQNYEVNFKDYCKKYGVSITDLKIMKKWLNAKCDVLAMWCHIWYKGDIFVSTDKNFFGDKKPLLLKLNAGNILKPNDAIKFLE